MKPFVKWQWKGNCRMPELRGCHTAFVPLCCGVCSLQGPPGLSAPIYFAHHPQNEKGAGREVLERSLAPGSEFEHTFNPPDTQPNLQPPPLQRFSLCQLTNSCLKHYCAPCFQQLNPTGKGKHLEPPGSLQLSAGVTHRNSSLLKMVPSNQTGHLQNVGKSPRGLSNPKPWFSSSRQKDLSPGRGG